MKPSTKRPIAPGPKHREATARLVNHGYGYSWLIASCPFCGGKHAHGGGGPTDDPYTFLGWRVPHCLEQPDGQYRLVEEAEKGGVT